MQAATRRQRSTTSPASQRHTRTSKPYLCVGVMEREKWSLRTGEENIRACHLMKVQVWARTIQGSWPISVWGQRWHRRLVSRLVPLPRLRVGLDGGVGQREVGKTWEGGDPDEAFATLSSGSRWVKHLLLSLGGGGGGGGGGWHCHRPSSSPL